MNNVILVPLHSIKFGFTTETKAGFTFAYITIFVISLLGNSVGLQVVVSAKTSSKRITYLLIKNLAVAELILTLAVSDALLCVAHVFRSLVWWNNGNYHV